MDKQQYDSLIAECKVHIGAIKEHEGRVAEATWKLADLLAPIEVVNSGHFNGSRKTGEASPNGRSGRGRNWRAGKDDNTVRNDDELAITLKMLADDLGLSKNWIGQLRRAANRFPQGRRIDDVGPAVHLAAQRVNGSPEATLEAMRERYANGRLRLRDFIPDAEDAAVLTALRSKATVERLAGKLTPGERTYVTAAMASPPVARERNDADDDEPQWYGDRARHLATLRRARTTLEHLSSDLRGSTDEQIVREVKGIEEVVVSLVDAVAVSA